MDIKRFVCQYRQEKWSQIICDRVESGLFIYTFCTREILE